MNELQFEALLPFMVLAAASMAVILLIAFRMSHTVIQVAAFLMACLVILAMWYVKDTLPQKVLPLLVVDGFGALFTGMIIFSMMAVGLFSYVYFEEREENPKEYYILLFLATLGAAILTISVHFISFFIGLEVLSVSLYALIAYLRNRNHAVESGMKYLVLAAVSSAFLLFGMALIYMETGSMEFTVIAQSIGASASSVLFMMGFGIMLVAIGFKLALAPFHLWAADVYQGAPAPVTAFIATVSKIGVFAVLLRFAQSVNLQQYPLMMNTFSVIAIASMIVGNLLALRQQNIKRLMGYSSIAHFGYLLVAFLPGNAAGVEAAAFYLVAYSITLLAVFGVISVLSTRMKDAEDLAMYKGLLYKRPVLSTVLIISFLSLAGIPLTAGFIAKFFVLASGVHRGLWPPVIVLVITSVIGLYYYLRVISTLFAAAPSTGSVPKTLHPFFYIATHATLIIMVIILCWLGIFPGNAVEGIRAFLLIR
ncbi:NADH-quinone oxidoreductase subunit N [Agriterribacter sp.]|uniref:NADH-quinone oxidoreductase subunit N n=1 Tax=Agriterribacter sp. TaxID=2821509 RepID=UPI002CE58DC7|nr:NADH-quinone oxidoreductase subunit N [Agriterribacter sp.]HTN07825.1 NADH-quinone oxidoreductase subunit N [Agriterribacter sp.]